MTLSKEEGKVYFISGGGTGGHIYPAVTVADALLEESDTHKIFYIGNPDNLEFDIISKKENITFLPVKVKGMPRKAGFGFIKWLWDLEVATWKSLFYILKYKPDAIFTTGGYVSAPILFAATILKKPFMIHDSDASPGLVSKLVAPCAKVVSVAFEKAKEVLNSDNIICNGNPIRTSFAKYTKEEALKELGLENKLTILAMGGSQGAKSINSAVVEVIKKFESRDDIQIILQTGKKNFDEVKKALEGIKNDNAIVRPYFEDMAIPLKAADIVIARAGSLSLSEINLLGLPSILVPYPYAAANHQWKNAMEMEEKGASICLEDSKCNGESLYNIIQSLIEDNTKLQKMATSAKNLAKPDATKHIVKELKSIIK